MTNISSGVSGEKGDPGPQPQRGFPGRTGSKGDPGLPGQKGDPGARGDAGELGEKGDVGSQVKHGHGALFVCLIVSSVSFIFCFLVEKSPFCISLLQMGGS